MFLIFNKRHYNKVIIFDLDETLGSFSDMESLWSGIHNYIKIQENALNKIDINQNAFNQLMDIYPEFLRTGILEILSYFVNKKRAKEFFRL